MTSCSDNSFRFEEPQPLNQPNLIKIPKKLRGTYYASNDSTYLYITSKDIIKQKKFSFSGLTDSLDIEIDSTKITYYNQDHLSASEDGFKLDLFLKNDSAFVQFSMTDTIFSLSSNQILRKYKGHYFLNRLRRNGFWRIEKIDISRKSLSFSTLRIPDDITSLSEITAIEPVTNSEKKIVAYQLNPSKKELKKLMKKTFRTTGKYRKISSKIIKMKLIERKTE